MKYYSGNCPDWRWCYKYNYPPLLEDLIHHIPYFEQTFIGKNENKAVTPLTQLCYVLPRPALSLLPGELSYKLITKHGDLYRTDYEFTWAFCKYFWEAHVNLPEINIEDLENFLQKI
jgi:5'-3' exonuclease